jgi:hypothetical protein
MLPAGGTCAVFVPPPQYADATAAILPNKRSSDIATTITQIPNHQNFSFFLSFFHRETDTERKKHTSFNDHKNKIPKTAEGATTLNPSTHRKNSNKKTEKKYPSHNKNKNKKSRPSNGLQLSSSTIKTLPQMHLFDTQTQDCFLFLDDDDDDDDAGIVEKITDLLSSEENKWQRKKKEERATNFARPNFLVHKNHRIQNIIISHTVVFPPSFLSQTTSFHPTPAQTRYIFSSNTSPILSQTR